MNIYEYNLNGYGFEKAVIEIVKNNTIDGLAKLIADESKSKNFELADAEMQYLQATHPDIFSFNPPNKYVNKINKALLNRKYGDGTFNSVTIDLKISDYALNPDLPCSVTYHTDQKCIFIYFNFSFNLRYLYLIHADFFSYVCKEIYHLKDGDYLKGQQIKELYDNNYLGCKEVAILRFDLFSYK